MLRRITYFFVVLILLALGAAIYYSMHVRRPRLSDKIPDVDKTREAKVLTAFFGLDNDLPLQGILLYYRALGQDGMPLVFSQEIDPTTLDQSDFEVITKNGETFEVEFVTLKPANEEFELRTVLFIGEYGNHPENPPVRVKIIDDLKSRSGQNYKGQEVPVIPLPAGPTISYAEHFVLDDAYPYVEKGSGCDCPKESTEQVVRAVWSGGVRAINGTELGDNELNAFTVTLFSNRDTVSVHPYKLADLGDGDNNIDLCLNVKGIPIKVAANAGIAIDPNNDQNPETEIAINSRW